MRFSDSHYFRALSSRNYRLFFTGQIISLTGFWMTRVAMHWLAYRLSHSVYLLGVLGFAGQIPSTILLPFAGVWIDRWNKRRILMICQVSLMLLSFVLGLLTFLQRVTIEWLIGLSILQGIIQAFDVPVRQAFVVEMVERRHDLSNAIALNSSMFNMARLVGPSIAGLIITVSGEAACFFIDALSYLPVIVSIKMMRIKAAKLPTPGHMLFKMKEGFNFAFGFAPVRRLLVMVAVTSFFGLSYLVLMPVVARDVLQGGPGTLGFLMGAAGLGAFAGAIFLAGRKNVVLYGNYIAYAGMGGGIGLILFSFSNVFVISLFFVTMASFGFMLQLASSNAVLQSIVDDDKRGRVMSLYALSFLGIAPFGSYFVGQLASMTDVLFTVRIGGLISLASAFLFLWELPVWLVQLKPIFARKGIIQEVGPAL